MVLGRDVLGVTTSAVTLFAGSGVRASFGFARGAGASGTGARFAVTATGETTMYLRVGRGSLEVSEHAALRLTERKITTEVAEAALATKPFPYFLANIHRQSESSDTVRVTYDKQVDAAYIYFAESIGVNGVARTISLDPQDIRGMVNIDLDHEGRLVGVEVLGARTLLPPEIIALAT